MTEREQGQPPSGYQSPFLSPGPSGYPQQPPYSPAPPSPSAQPEPPLFDPEALFRPPPPPRPPALPPGYPNGADGGRASKGVIAGVVAVVLVLLGVGFWAISRQGSKPPQQQALVGDVSGGPVTVPFAKLPPAPPTPVGFVHKHISGMEFDVPGDCRDGDGTDLGEVGEGLPQNVSILYACLSEDGHRLVVVTSYDIGMSGDSVEDISSPEAMDVYKANLGGRGGDVQVGPHQVLGQAGLLGVVKCGCERPVYYTDAIGIGADSQYYEIIAAQVDAPHPDATAIIDSARPTR
jgi:hypothetical protein